MKTIRAIIVGFGIVGSGVASVLQEKQAALRKSGLDVKVVGVCEKNGCLVDEKGLDLKELLDKKASGRIESHPAFTREKSLGAIKQTPADVVVEVTPTNMETGEPGLSHILAGFASGKHVVTSNKGPLALKYWDVVEAAEKAGKQFRFEATVCGGMPAINLFRNCLQFNKVNAIKGILNGTTNFILTKMFEDNLSFQAALQEAREMGIAEADSSLDVKAIDPAAKLVILANAVLGQRKTFKDVKRTGIEGITVEAIHHAKKNNFVIKLIGEASQDTLSVAPRLLPLQHPLNVGGTLNALMFDTDMAKDIYVVGRGAGKIETASAVLGDLFEISKCCQ